MAHQRYAFQNPSFELLPGVTLVGGLLFCLAMAFLSDGAYQDDDLGHYLHARWAWNDARYLLDEWGRPGLTVLLFPAAALGWTACRVVMAVASVGAVGLVYGIARRLGLRHAQWVPLLCFVQPLFLIMSYGTMTEIALAFYLALAVWLHVQGKPGAGAAALSLCFVTRYESIALAPLWLIALRQARCRPAGYVLLLWAPVVYNLAGALWLERWPAAYWVHSPQLAEYGSGTPLTMLTRSMATFGPAVAIVALVGCLSRWRSPNAWIVPGCMLTYVAVHTLIYWFGTHATGGYPRLLAGVSPLAAIAAAHGIERLTRGRPVNRRRSVLRLAVVVIVLGIGLELEPRPQDEAWIYLIDKVQPLVRAAAAIGVVLVLWWYAALRVPAPSARVPASGQALGVLAAIATAVPLLLLVRPHGLSRDAMDIRASVEWIQANRPDKPTIVATNIWASHFLNRGYNVVLVDSSQPLAGAEAGTLLIWDAEYGPSERFGLTEEAMSRLPTWQGVWGSPPRGQRGSFARVYENRPEES